MTQGLTSERYHWQLAVQVSEQANALVWSSPATRCAHAPGEVFATLIAWANIDLVRDEWRAEFLTLSRLG